jgi:hypothetical protein
MPKHSRPTKGPHRTGISLPPNVYQSAMDRMDELGLSSFSEYLRTLIERDLNGTGPSPEEIGQLMRKFDARLDALEEKTAQDSPGYNTKSTNSD